MAKAVLAMLRSKVLACIFRETNLFGREVNLTDTERTNKSSRTSEIYVFYLVVVDYQPEAMVMT
jgi:hypothetical protein